MIPLKYRLKRILIISFFLSFLSLLFLHNYYESATTSYSLKSITDELPKILCKIILINDYDMDSFKGFYGYLFNIISIIVMILSFIKGMSITKTKKEDEFSFLQIRLHTSSLFIHEGVSYLINNFIILGSTYLVSLIYIATKLHEGYLTILIYYSMLLLLSLFFYILGIAIYSLKNETNSIILTIVLFVGFYVLKFVDKDILNYLNPLFLPTAIISVKTIYSLVGIVLLSVLLYSLAILNYSKKSKLKD